MHEAVCADHQAGIKGSEIVAKHIDLLVRLFGRQHGEEHTSFRGELLTAGAAGEERIEQALPSIVRLASFHRREIEPAETPDSGESDRLAHFDGRVRQACASKCPDQQWRTAALSRDDAKHFIADRATRTPVSEQLIYILHGTDKVVGAANEQQRASDRLNL